MIPGEIAWETHNIIPTNVLEDIIKKLAAVFENREGISCEGGKCRLYVKAEETPHLKIMKGLGLVEKEPIGGKRRKRNASGGTYEITQKAWRWHALSMAMFRI